jgi:hypothetical protein
MLKQRLERLVGPGWTVTEDTIDSHGGYWKARCSVIFTQQTKYPDILPAKIFRKTVLQETRIFSPHIVVNPDILPAPICCEILLVATSY